MGGERGGSRNGELSFADLMEYTEWERGKWHEWLRKNGSDALKVSAGPHGDGRFESVGDVMRHIFSAEKRYVERLAERPMTDAASVPKDDVEALFQFGAQSRKELREFIETLPAAQWDALKEFKLMNSTLSASPRKIIAHVLMHEIRHWAQIGTMLRLSGMKDDFHDFLFSPVMGGELRRGEAKA